MFKSLALSFAILAASGFGNLAAKAETAVLAGGCFWCVESDLERLPAVREAISGYAGGETENPTYKNYDQGGHREVVQVDFDETQMSYRELLDVFLRTVDVTDAGGQFCDRGHAYSTAIYPLTDEQAEAAKAAIADVGKVLGAKIVTPVEAPALFWKAEDYHQNYYKSDVRTLTRFGYVKRSDAYKGYRRACGRDLRVKKVWGAEAYKGLPHHGS